MNTSSQQPAVTLQDLEAFLEETLTDSEMARIESALRADPELRRQLAELMARRDQGEHSVGAIWRRFQISCPSREEWALYLANELPKAVADYCRFHLEVIGCQVCQANLDDLREHSGE
jgi:hypothetical protein